MKVFRNWTVAAFAIIAAAAISTGCTSMSSTVKAPGACPLCKGDLVASEVAQITCDKIVCMKCGASKSIKPGVPASMIDYLPPEANRVSVCDHCKCAVGTCAKCK